MKELRKPIAILIWLVAAFGLVVVGDPASALVVGIIGAIVWPWRGRKEVER